MTPGTFIRAASRASVSGHDRPMPAAAEPGRQVPGSTQSLAAAGAYLAEVAASYWGVAACSAFAESLELACSSVSSASTGSVSSTC
mgnify:CR=1 FL=1